MQSMAKHVTHTGVHDHGFNNVSTYGNLLRLWHEGRLSGIRVGAPLLRARVESLRRRCRRRAGPAQRMAAAIFIPSTVRNRCLSIPFGRFGCLRSATGWAMR